MIDLFEIIGGFMLDLAEIAKSFYWDWCIRNKLVEPYSWSED